MTVHVDVELTEAQKQQLEVIARHEQVALGELIAGLVQSRLDYDAWVRAKVQEGIDAVERGAILSLADVEARAALRRAELLARSGGS